MTKPSLRKAINAFCKGCLYDPNGGTGTWREQVSACTSRDCPLYAVRPTAKPGVRGAEKRANAA